MAGIYGVLMTLLLALLAGVVWLTLSSQPGTGQPGLRTEVAAVVMTPTLEATAPITPEQATVLAAEIPASAVPLPEPTDTEAPLPTNTETLEPTATPTLAPTPTSTPLSLPLPTPPKVARLQSGWEILTLGAPITALGADSNGFIWLGTKNSITQQSPNDRQISWNFVASDLGLGNEGVQVILGDKQGGVWIGGNGAAYFNGLLWRPFTADDGLVLGLIRTIAEDNQRRIWLGSSAGLGVWNGASFFTLNRDFGLPNDDITALLNDGSKMWIGSNGGGLYRFENNQLQVFNAGNIGMETNSVTALGKLPNGTLLIGSDQGLMTFTGSKAEMIDDVPHNRITSIVTALQGDVWVATDGGGLHHFVNGRWSRLVDNANLPDSRVMALTIDLYGALWIATSDGQLTRHVGTLE